MSAEAILKTFPYFDQMSSDLLRELVLRGQTVAMPTGEIICREGEMSTSMYVILAGEVAVFKHDEAEEEIALAVLKAGDFLGELAFLDNQPRSATAVCQTDCELFVLDQNDFIGFLESHPEMLRHVILALSGRVRQRIEAEFNSELTRRAIKTEAELERHRALAQMVAGVAHELNTPLGIANMMAKMIGDRLEREEVTAVLAQHPSSQAIAADLGEAAQLLERNVLRAHKLVESFKKISVSQLTDTLTDVDLAETVADVLRLLRPKLRQAKLVVEVQNHLLDEQGGWLGYPGYLTQVMINLLTNIERYAYADGGQAVIELRSLLWRKVEAFQIVVRDYGRGIEPDHLAHIFDPFFTTGRGQGGTGLGMAIVYNLVTEALQGTIEIVSAVGEGTAVTIIVPQKIQ